MLSHPSKYYIYYLFSERRLDVGAIVQLLGDSGLPVPQTEKQLGYFVQVLLRERKKMRIPAGFNPTQRPLNKQTQRFMKDWRIKGMWLHDPMVDRALDILVGEPLLRRFLEILLLGPLGRSYIAARARQHFELSERELNTGVVRHFEHYFWNRSQLNIQEWKDIIFNWIPGRNDEMLAALTAPHDQVGAAVSLNAAGMQNSLSSVTIYQTARDQMFRLMMEHCLQDRPSLARTQAAGMALQAVTHAEEQLDRHRGGGAELLQELQRIDTVYDNRPLTTVNELPLTPRALPTGEVASPEPALSEETEKEAS